MKLRERLAAKFPSLARHVSVLRTSWVIQNEADVHPVDRSDHEFLPAALEIIERPPSPGLRWLLLSLCGLFLVALLWSFLGKVDVIASAKGKVVPAGNVKTIQPIELGYVRAIHVRNGQRVKAGDLLVELDPTLAQADAARAAKGLLTAEVIAARNSALLAHIEGKASRFAAPPGASPVTAATQERFVDAAIAEYEGERASLLQQEAERRSELAAAAAEIAKLERTLPLVERQLAARRQLAEKGYFSNLRLLEYEQLKLEHEQNIEIQHAKAAQARAAIGNVEAQLHRLKAAFGRAAVAELSESQEKEDLAREDVTKSTRRAEFQQLRAPVSGTVQQLSISTVGGIVEPAQVLMIIVPDAAEPVVEARILNRDIGFVREGQEVRVKLEAYPFTDYGVVPGVVESISRDAIVSTPSSPPTGRATRAENEPGNELVYSARIRLLKRTIRVRNQDQPIGPGLALTAEIKTGERRIIQYLLSPISQTIDEAARER